MELMIFLNIPVAKRFHLREFQVSIFQTQSLLSSSQSMFYLKYLLLGYKVVLAFWFSAIKIDYPCINYFCTECCSSRWFPIITISSPLLCPLCRRTKMQKKKDSDGVERTIPCPHKVYHTFNIHTSSNSIFIRVATKCSETMLLCANTFILMGLVFMYVRSVVKHL